MFFLEVSAGQFMGECIVGAYGRLCPLFKGEFRCIRQSAGEMRDTSGRTCIQFLLDLVTRTAAHTTVNDAPSYMVTKSCLEVTWIPLE